MIRGWSWVLVVAGALGASCGTSRDAASTQASARHNGLVATSEDGDDENIALDQVPAAVRAAALNALPGFVITSAERETENGVVIYSLTGTVNGVSTEIEVSADGSSAHVEDDGDDDDHDGDDDDD